MTTAIPFVAQERGSDCGAAALAMVAGALGVPTTLHEARVAAGTATNGTTLAGIVRGAEALGLRARGLHLSAGALDALAVPAIVHRRGHWLVLAALDRRRAQVIDPARGPRSWRRATLASGYSGYAIEVRRGPTD